MNHENCIICGENFCNCFGQIFADSDDSGVEYVEKDDNDENDN